MSTPRILIVDDEAPIVELVRTYLEQDGLEVIEAHDGPSGLQLIRDQAPDVVVLDVMLPGLDGIEVLRQARTFSDAYVIMLTARVEEVDRIVGLSVGADDYLVKPFALAELSARLHALLRRRGAVLNDPLVVGDLVIDPRRHVATREGRDLRLTRREFALLQAFADHPGIVLSRDQLLTQVWGYTFDVETNVVDVFVGYLRRKLEAEGEPRVLHTVRGVGWALRP